MDENDATPTAPQPAPEAAPATETISAEEQIKKLEEEKQGLYAQLIRRQADYENYRKRVAREQQEFRERAEAEIVCELLPVLDGFERVLAAPAGGVDEDYKTGIELIYKQLLDFLTRAGLHPVPTTGKTFDPYLHHAVERVESGDHKDEEIVAELQRGYTFKKQLLRPALVRVAVRPESAASAKKEDKED